MDASDYIAVFAGIIAAISLFVSIDQALLTRKHNKLSVKPILSIYRLEFTNLPLDFILKNKGLGPAIIDKVSVWVDDKEIINGKPNSLYAALAQVKIPSDKVAGHLIPQGDALQPNEEVILLRIPLESNPFGSHTEFVEAFRRIKFKVFYKSIYQETSSFYGNG